MIKSKKKTHPIAPHACNMCFHEMHAFNLPVYLSSDETFHGVSLFIIPFVCINPKCPNYGLMQLPASVMSNKFTKGVKK